jgi:carbon monoxide dehydrogenase subunit G
LKHGVAALDRRRGTAIDGLAEFTHPASMEVKLEKTWPLDATREQAWAVLADVRAVAACMPGAQITEQVDATHYKGQVRSKLGPALMTFLGEVEVLALDPGAMRLEMVGKGADKGGSAASMKLAARLEAGADPAEAILAGEAVVTVSGKLAQFGGRLLVPVADAMLAQFAENFQAAAAQVPAGVRDAAVPAQASASSPGQEPASVPAAASDDAPGDAIEAATSQVPALPSGTVPPRELNALSLAWAIVRGWLRELFGRRPA